MLQYTNMTSAGDDIIESLWQNYGNLLLWLYKFHILHPTWNVLIKINTGMSVEQGSQFTNHYTRCHGAETETLMYILYDSIVIVHVLHEFIRWLCPVPKYFKKSLVLNITSLSRVFLSVNYWPLQYISS